MLKNDINPKLVNSLALAYMGDAVIDLHVRHHLIQEGSVKPNQLHHKAVNYVSAKAQAAFLAYLMDKEALSDEELVEVRRGRNAKSGTTPKNTDVHTYRYGTAFEALIGYLYFKGQADRIAELMATMFEKNHVEGRSERG